MAKLIQENMPLRNWGYNHPFFNLQVFYSLGLREYLPL
jgi:hypothetical protein